MCLINIQLLFGIWNDLACRSCQNVNLPNCTPTFYSIDLVAQAWLFKLKRPLVLCNFGAVLYYSLVQTNEWMYLNQHYYYYLELRSCLQVSQCFDHLIKKPMYSIYVSDTLTTSTFQSFYLSQLDIFNDLKIYCTGKRFYGLSRLNGLFW